MNPANVYQTIWDPICHYILYLFCQKHFIFSLLKSDEFFILCKVTYNRGLLLTHFNTICLQQECTSLTLLAISEIWQYLCYQKSRYGICYLRLLRRKILLKFQCFCHGKVWCLKNPGSLAWNNTCNNRHEVLAVVIHFLSC